jgi:hypothetical protein
MVHSPHLWERRMAYFPALELIAMHKIWDSDGLFTAVRGRNLLRRRQYWHEAIHEWQGVGQKKCGPDP